MIIYIRIMSVVGKLLPWRGGESPTASEYVCQKCRTRHERRYQSCPECGSFCLDRADWSFAD